MKSHGIGDPSNMDPTHTTKLSIEMAEQRFTVPLLALSAVSKGWSDGERRMEEEQKGGSRWKGGGREEN